MALEREPIDISTSQDLLRLVEEVIESGSSRVLVDGDDEIAVLTPLPASRRWSPRKHKRLEPERILDIVGIGRSGTNSDIARFKHGYIADAVDPRQR